MRWSTIITWICCSFIVVPSYAATIIHAGLLIDGRHDEPLSEMSITIDEGRIVSVSKGYIQPQEGDKLTAIALNLHVMIGEVLAEGKASSE